MAVPAGYAARPAATPSAIWYGRGEGTAVGFRRAAAGCRLSRRPPAEGRSVRAARS